MEECNRMWGECKVEYLSFIVTYMSSPDFLLHSICYISFVWHDEPLFSFVDWLQKEVGQKDRLLQQLKHKLEESKKKQVCEPVLGSQMGNMVG